MAIDRFSDNLKAKRDQLKEQSQNLVQQAMENGRSAIEVARSTVEDEVKDVLGRVRQLESQSQTVVREQLNQRFARILAIEQQIWQRAEGLVDRVKPEISSRFPALSPVVDRVGDAIRTVDARLHQGRAGGAPIADYDALNVKQVITKLAALNADQLRAVRAYEVAHKNRVTVLRAVDEHLAA